LHWLTAVVWILQAEGRNISSVWFIVIPKEEPPPLRREHRHCGEDWTTVESCEQHEDDEFKELSIMSFSQGLKLENVVVHIWKNVGKKN